MLKHVKNCNNYKKKSLQNNKYTEIYVKKKTTTKTKDFLGNNIKYCYICDMFCDL